jgi:hypothetical protein
MRTPARTRPTPSLSIGVSYDGTLLGTASPLGPKAKFTKGLSHLNGRKVRVLADGIEYNDLTVVGGTLTLPSRRQRSRSASAMRRGSGCCARRSAAFPARTDKGLRAGVRLFARLIDSGPFAIFDKRGERDFMLRSAEQSADGHGATAVQRRHPNKSIGERLRLRPDERDRVGRRAAVDHLAARPTYDLEELQR